MEDYPKTILDFEDRFDTEAACREYLFQLCWPNGFRCPQCGHGKAWASNRGLYECCQCRGQASVTAGTIFHDTRKPLRLWFRAMWYVVSQKNGVSALGMQRVLGLGSYRTAWTWLHKLRRVMVRPGRDRLSGTVEVDETYIGGKRSGKRGRGADGKTMDVIAVEEKCNCLGRIRLRRVADASANSLTPVVNEMIEPGSVVRTDGWDGYLGLNKDKYTRNIVRKEAYVGDDLLPLVNRIAALLKSWLGGAHQGAVRSSHLDYYLDEFTFRFNRRSSRSRGKLFYRLVQQAVIAAPVTGEKILGKQQ